MPLLFGIILQAATYESVTDQVDVFSGLAGFENQFNALTEFGEAGGDIAVSLKKYVPYNTELLTMSEEEAKNSNFTDVAYCTNGMLRMKVYVPPHLEKFQASFSFRPNNNGILYATFQPNGTIDEANPVDLSVDSSTYWNSFWNGHKTIEFILSNVFSFSYTPMWASMYNIDTSKGGYLYLAFTQSDNIVSNKDYNPGYAITVSAYYTFKTPMTPQMKQEILDDYNNGETSQMLTTNECSQYTVNMVNGEKVADFHPAPFAIDVEGGAPLPCEERGEGYQEVDGVCYPPYIYECKFTQGGTWTGQRCVTPAEDDCNNDPETQWIVATNQCLPKYAGLDTNESSNNSDAVDMAIVEDNSDVASDPLNGGISEILFSPFQANTYGWASRLTVSNANVSEAAVYDIEVRGSNNQHLIDIANVSVSPDEDIAIELTKVNSVLKAQIYDANGTLVTQSQIQTSETNGTLSLSPVSMPGREDLFYKFEYGYNLPGLGGSQNDGGTNGGTDNLVITTPTDSSSSSTGSSGGTGNNGSDNLSITTPSGGSSSASTSASSGGSGGDNLSITMPTASSESSSSTMTAGGSSSSAQPTYSTVEARLMDEGTTFDISGWLYHYDFAEIADGFDFVYNSAQNGKLFRLRPNSGDELKWEEVKGIALAPEEKQYAFVLVGDWDGDGQGKNDWVVIRLSDNKVYKFEGNKGSGQIKLGSEPLPVSVQINGTKVTFHQ